MKRSTRHRWLIIGVLVVAVAAAAGAMVFLTSRGGQGTRYLTSKARTGSVAATVDADFTVGAAQDSTTISLGGASSSSTTTASTSSSSSGGGIVTAVAVAAGGKPHTLQRLLTVSGSPVYAFVSSSPLYKTLSTSLSSGAQTANVEVLQRALEAAGYFSGTVNGEFGTTTKTALEDWQAAHGLSKTGEVTAARFVWVPTGAVIESWSVIVGSNASAGTTLATVEFPRPLVATAAVSQGGHRQPQGRPEGGADDLRFEHVAHRHDHVDRERAGLVIELRRELGELGVIELVDRRGLRGDLPSAERPHVGQVRHDRLAHGDDRPAHERARGADERRERHHVGELRTHPQERQGRRA